MNKRGKNRFFQDKKGESRFLIKDKKGAELMIGTFVVIVLAVMVLIVLIIFWELQTGKFSDFLGNFFGESNVDNLVASCNSFVIRKAVYDYCCVKRKTRHEVEGKMVEEEFTCKELVGKDFVGRRINNRLNCRDTVC
jgi:hypothetical protein